MNQPVLGQVITTNVQRDAIHIAILPVTAYSPLSPGQHVYFCVAGNTEFVNGCPPEDAIGIVDPFLTYSVEKGEQCWVFMMPNTITGLRHEWTHPALEQESRAISEFWLRDFAAKQDGLSYEDMMQQLRADGSVVHHMDLNYEDLDEDGLIHHFKIVTGITLQDPYFRCAC